MKVSSITLRVSFGKERYQLAVYPNRLKLSARVEKGKWREVEPWSDEFKFVTNQTKDLYTDYLCW